MPYTANDVCSTTDKLLPFDDGGGGGEGGRGNGGVLIRRPTA